MKKAYLLSFDPYKTDAVTLHQIIKDSLLISGWWHYLASTYILISYQSLQKIHNEIYLKWPMQRYFIVEIYLKNRNGWLPPDAWEWIRKNIQTPK